MIHCKQKGVLPNTANLKNLHSFSWPPTLYDLHIQDFLSQSTPFLSEVLKEPQAFSKFSVPTNSQNCFFN